MHIAPDSRCAVCGAVRQLEVHHIEPRGMGGSSRPEIEADANQVVLCRSCHGQITEHRWHLDRSSDQLAVTDMATGELLVRRRFQPGFSASTYFGELQSLEQGFDGLLRGIPYLEDDQLVELFLQLRGFHQRSWVVQAAICWEAKQRSVYGERAWEAMGKSFGIGWRQAYNLARVWETFFHGRETEFCIQMHSSPLDEVTWYVVACETDNPPFWLAYAEDRKAECPGYTVADFKEEIRAAGAHTDEDACSSDERTRCRWLRVYCAKLERVVTPGRCPGCDQGLFFREEVLT
jgi:hypothetical protein